MDDGVTDCKACGDHKYNNREEYRMAKVLDGISFKLRNIATKLTGAECAREDSDDKRIEQENISEDPVQRTDHDRHGGQNH